MNICIANDEENPYTISIVEDTDESGDLVSQGYFTIQQR